MSKLKTEFKPPQKSEVGRRRLLEEIILYYVRNGVNTVPELTERLGYTRVRIGHIVRELRDEGVIEKIQPGRPYVYGIAGE